MFPFQLIILRAACFIRQIVKCGAWFLVYLRSFWEVIFWSNAHRKWKLCHRSSNQAEAQVPQPLDPKNQQFRAGEVRIAEGDAGRPGKGGWVAAAAAWYPLSYQGRVTIPQALRLLPYITGWTGWWWRWMNALRSVQLKVAQRPTGNVWAALGFQPLCFGTFLCSSVSPHHYRWNHFCDAILNHFSVELHVKVLPVAHWQAKSRPFRERSAWVSAGVSNQGAWDIVWKHLLSAQK